MYRPRPFAVCLTSGSNRFLPQPDRARHRPQRRKAKTAPDQGLSGHARMQPDRSDHDRAPHGDESSPATRAPPTTRPHVGSAQSARRACGATGQAQRRLAVKSASWVWSARTVAPRHRRPAAQPPNVQRPATQPSPSRLAPAQSPKSHQKARRPRHAPSGATGAPAQPRPETPARPPSDARGWPKQSFHPPQAAQGRAPDPPYPLGPRPAHRLGQRWRNRCHAFGVAAHHIRQHRLTRAGRY